MDQGKVWEHVDSKLGRMGASSPTHSYHAVYEKFQRDLADYEARLQMPENACGVGVEIDGKLNVMDLFDKPSTLLKFWPRLVRSYVLAALDPEPSPGTKADINEFMECVLSSQCDAFVPAGVGTTMRITHTDITGAALVCEDRLVHLSVFAKPNA
jgi:hypothetical protein